MAATKEKMQLCIIRYGDEWISVKGKDTTVEVNISDIPQCWDIFTQEEKDFLDDLINYGSTPSPISKELTSSEMRRFLDLSRKVQEERHADDPAVPPPKVAPKPVKVSKPPTEQGSVVEHISRYETVREVSRKTNALDRLEGAQKVVDKVSSEPYWLVWYYIPEELNPEGLNPSIVFRRLGFRFDGSCWIMPESSLATPAFKGVLAMWEPWREPADGRPGMDFCYIKQDAAYQEMLRNRAQKYLEQTICEAHGSLLRSIDVASKNYEEAMKTATEAGENLKSKEGRKKADQLRSRQISHVKGAIRSVKDKLAATIECAILFDHSMAVQDLLKGLREAISAVESSLSALQRARELGK